MGCLTLYFPDIFVFPFDGSNMVADFFFQPHPNENSDINIRFNNEPYVNEKFYLVK